MDGGRGGQQPGGGGAGRGEEPQRKETSVVGRSELLQDNVRQSWLDTVAELSRWTRGHFSASLLLIVRRNRSGNPSLVSEEAAAGWECGGEEARGGRAKNREKDGCRAADAAVVELLLSHTR